MTIHRAKGLEFEVVCVADLGRGPRWRAELMRVGRDGRFGLRLSEPGTGRRESALDYRTLGEERQAAEAREERRLFYVAMTRARERLILSGAAKLEAWPAIDGPRGRRRADRLDRAGAWPSATDVAVSLVGPEDLPAAPEAEPSMRIEDRRPGLPAMPAPTRPVAAPRRRRRGAAAPRRRWPRSATPRWPSTSAAATASTPSACSGCPRSAQPWRRRRGRPGRAGAERDRARHARARPARAPRLPPTGRGHRGDGGGRSGALRADGGARRRRRGADHRAGRPLRGGRAVPAPGPGHRRAARGALPVPARRAC